MIIGNIHHLDLVPYLHPKIKQTIDYIKDNVNNQTAIGRYLLEGDNVFFMLSKSPIRQINEADPEYHEKYLDVQILLEGSEGMAVSTLPPHTRINENNLSENDIAFIETPNDERLITLYANDFIVLYPHEVHKPLCSIGDNQTSIRKIVVKIAVDYLIGNQ